jgi:SAM-dependent methyltransferase
MHKRSRIIEKIKKIVAPKYGYYNFLKSVNPKGNFLDVGCGSSCSYIRNVLPDINYVALDIIAYKPSLHDAASKYIQSTPEHFVETIESMEGYYDTVFSLHNLEHCNDRTKTTAAMAKALKNNGKMCLIFPSERSINFPTRKGTLNYYDDKEHQSKPPNFEEIIKILEKSNMTIIYKNAEYKPIVPYFIGLIFEPLSKITKKVKFGSYGTWAYWGFEAVIRAIKNIDSKKNGT